MTYGQLHQLIEQSKWDVALESLRSDPTIRSDAAEPHRDDLPLHMACERRAPDGVILEILKCNEDAAKWKGRGGSLPLHIATQRNLSGDVVETLIRVYPGALDIRNSANYTPRDYGHQEPFAFQSLHRPTSCWHQLMTDEAKEEEQDRKLLDLHEQVDTALTQLQRSNDNFDDMTTRLEHVEKKLREFEDLKAEDLEAAVTNLERSIRDTMDKIENRLSTVEDDVKAAAARDFMARAASRAHQSDVVKMQKISAQEAKTLRKEVEDFQKTALIKEAQDPIEQERETNDPNE